MSVPVKPRFSVIIPARFGSTRLPGKPLLDICGKPMIQWVYEQACRSCASDVIIATDDERIVDVARGFDARVTLTSPDHVSGTDRLQEVVSQLALGSDEIVVNVQGDEPLIPPENINQVAALLESEPDAGIATLSETITDMQDVFNPNVVKVVANGQHEALYFSRAPIPWQRDEFKDGVSAPGSGKPEFPFQRHIGIYAYRVELLHRFIQWPPSPIEVAESLEQLRAMWNGVKIKVATAVIPPPPGIDTRQDLEQLRALVMRRQDEG